MALPTYLHSSGRTTWVILHPDDNLVGLHPTYLTNPETFKPQVNPRVKKYEAWGINDHEGAAAEIIDGFPKFFTRVMDARHLYKGTASPQKQFVKHLVGRKEKQLAGRDKGDRAKRDYILHTSITGIKDKDDNEFIWRRIKVSGALKLNLLQDKIIQPTMGWSRGYHGYLFTDRTDGAVFGSKYPTHIDMGHMYLNGHGFIPDDKYTIADILENEGSSLGYLYDLGDCWHHEIVVEKILSESESNGRFELLAGSGACPAEDIGGYNSWIGTLASLRIHPKDWDITRQIHDSPNYYVDKTIHHPGWFYDPYKFDLGAARHRVQEALASHPPAESGARTKMFPFTEFDVYFMCTRYIHENQPPSPKQAFKGTEHLIETIREGKESKSVALCENCGKPDGLKKCARCTKAWYCSKECQHTRWREHKLSCGESPKSAAKHPHNS